MSNFMFNKKKFCNGTKFSNGNMICFFSPRKIIKHVNANVNANMNMNANVLKKSKPVIIIQTSYQNTGSTVLTNLLYGLIQHTKPVFYFESLTDEVPLMNDVNILKTHILDINKLLEKFGESYDIYFVCSERNDKTISTNFKNMKNVLIFDYNELNEVVGYSVDNIVQNVFEKLSLFLPKHIGLNIKTAVERINNMNSLYEKIKKRQFTYFDKFYHIHGSHRGRSIQNVL